MHGSEAAYAGPEEAFQGAYPEFEIGVDGVLGQHGDVGGVQPFELVGDFLHGERVGYGAGAEPYAVESCADGHGGMGGVAGFGEHFHPGLGLHGLEPAEAARAHSLKGAGARLP